MGHCSAIAHGLALYQEKNVVCLDGDGSIIMHMGNLVTIGSLKAKNLIHVVFNNGTYESVGGQWIENKNLDFCQVAKSCG